MRRFITLAVVAAMLAIAGCGDDDEPSNGGANTGADSANTAETPGGKSFKLGYITDLSGPLRESYSPTLEGFQLYMDKLNEDGGIDGHPVDTIVRDDGLDANAAVSAAEELTAQEKVSGIFGLSLSSTHEAVYAAMERAGVPVVTGFSGIAAALPPAKPFAYSAGTLFEVAGQAAGEFTSEIAPDGGKLVCVTFESVGGIAACEANEAVAREAGFEVERVVFPVDAREFTSIGSDIAGRDPDVVVGHYGSEQNVGVIAALRQAGYEGPYVVANYGATEQAIERGMEAAGSNENIYMFSRYASIDEDSAGTKQLEQAAEQFGTDFDLSNAQVSGWGLGRVAHEALAKCGYPCDPAGLDKALQGLEVDMQGITGGPLRFTADDHYGESHWRLYRFDPDEEAFMPEGDWLALPPEVAKGAGG